MAEKQLDWFTFCDLVDLAVLSEEVHVVLGLDDQFVELVPSDHVVQQHDAVLVVVLQLFLAVVLTQLLLQFILQSFDALLQKRLQDYVERLVFFEVLVKERVQLLVLQTLHLLEYLLEVALVLQLVTLDGLGDLPEGLTTGILFIIIQFADIVAAFHLHERAHLDHESLADEEAHLVALLVSESVHPVHQLPDLIQVPAEVDLAEQGHVLLMGIDHALLRVVLPGVSVLLTTLEALVLLLLLVVVPHQDVLVDALALHHLSHLLLLLDPGVVQQILDRGPLVLVYHQTSLDKVPTFFAAPVEIDPLVHHLLSQLLLAPSLPGDLPVKQLVGTYPDRPDVTLIRVPVLPQGLRTHVQRRTNVHVRLQGLRLRSLSETEIRQLSLAGLVH